MWSYRERQERKPNKDGPPITKTPGSHKQKKFTKDGKSMSLDSLDSMSDEKDASGSASASPEDKNKDDKRAYVQGEMKVVQNADGSTDSGADPTSFASSGALNESGGNAPEPKKGGSRRKYAKPTKERQ